VYTYFVITPGFDEQSCIMYPTGSLGNYFKFGDSTSDSIRQAYQTHNPDFHVAGIVDSSAISGPYLGTLLKNFIIERLGIAAVGATEWFSVNAKDSWKLFYAMEKAFDVDFVDRGDIADLKDALRDCLT